MSAAVAIPDLEGDLAYPRCNGEPVFEAPWQSRAFGMVVSMHKAGLFEWDEFKVHLIRRIELRTQADGGVAPQSDAEEASRYYESWTEAMYDLIQAKDMLSDDDITTRQQEFLSGDRQDVY